jgi:hypothetical protein
MERANAERIFALLNDINGDLRGRVIPERWWLVWITMGVEILITSIITQLLRWSGEQSLEVYLAIWSVHVALIAPIIFYIHRRSGGQRTATETYIWWIWATYIVCSTIAAFFSQHVTEPTRSAAPLVALLAAFAFSMMAMISHRYYLAGAVIFIGVTFAMTLFPHVEFLIFGGVWFLVLISLGTYSYRTIQPHMGKRL